jgi:integrase/recombinase XerD
LDVAAAVDQDRRVVELWLHGRSRHTQRAYRRYATQFLAYVQKPLRTVALEDLQAFASSIDASKLQPGSRQRVLSAIKSLFGFAARLKYVPFDVAAPLRLPAVRATLADRILEPHDVACLIAAADTPRNRLMLHLLYVAGLRVSELAELRWRDMQPRRDGGQVTVLGKGGKTRTIRLDAQIWVTIEHARGTAPIDLPVFVSRRGGSLHTSQVLRIVKAAARRAGIDRPVSPHWLRHCHASHALEGGAPIDLVQRTLGHSNVATTTLYLHARPNESSSKFLPKLP